jgi:hypothetical protein
MRALTVLRWSENGAFIDGQGNGNSALKRIHKRTKLNTMCEEFK